MTSSNHIATYAHAKSSRGFHPLSRQLIDAAIYVHKALGPGFLEKAYHNALCIVLEREGITFTREYDVRVLFEDRYEIATHRLDLLVGDDLVVELKAIRDLDRAHFAVVRSYMGAVGTEHGLILNFGRPTLEVRRIGWLGAPRPAAATN